MMKEFEFFIYGCSEHINEFKELMGKVGYLRILDSGKLKETDVNYGKDCAFEYVGEGFADSFVLVGLEVEK